MDQVPRQRLKGYVQTMIVGMQYHYKTSDGHRLPNPPPGCFVSLHLEPSNPYHHNAIKVINEADTHHLGYIIREIADVLTPFLKDRAFSSARGILSNPDHLYSRIPCQVLLFFAVPPELVPPLPRQLDFYEDLSSPHFMLARTPVAFTGCSLADYDSYVAHSRVSLHTQPDIAQNLDEPHRPPEVHLPRDIDDPPDTDATVNCSRGLDGGMERHSSARFSYKTKKATEPSPPTEAITHVLAAEWNDVASVKCKQLDRAPFVQCARSACPMYIHGSCILGVVGCTCLFCLYLACLGEKLRAEKGSDSYVPLERKCEKAMNNAICFFGKDVFMRLQELSGLDHPTQVQVRCSTNMQCSSVEGIDGEAGLDLPTQEQLACSINRQCSSVEELDGDVDVHLPSQMQPPCSINRECFSVEGTDGEAVGTSTIVERSAAKEKKEKVNNAGTSGRQGKTLEENEVAGRGKRRLPLRPRLDRACKKRIQAQPPWRRFSNSSCITLRKLFSFSRSSDTPIFTRYQNQLSSKPVVWKQSEPIKRI